MKKFYSRALLLLLAVLLVLPLASCQPEVPPQKITIEEDPAYSDETLRWAEETILSLVRYGYKKYMGMKEDAPIPEKVDANLQKYVHRICQIIAVNPIPEERYRSAITALAQDGTATIDEFFALKRGDGAAYEQTRKLYLELAHAFGAEQVASMVYDGCLLIYDMNYETAMERFEDLSYPYLKLEAEAIAAEKAIFANGVQKEAFVTLLKCVSATAELLAPPAEGIADTFSDAEVLDMIRRLEPAKIDISAKGWEILLSYLPVAEENSYFSGLKTAFQQNGDISRVSAVMGDAVKLWASVLQKLTPEDIATIRAGEREVLFNSVFSRFDEKDWALFTSVTSVSLENAKYSALAQEQYGEAYLEYVDGIEKIDIDQLRASVGRETFYQNLLNYIACICPAISYEVSA